MLCGGNKLGSGNLSCKEFNFLNEIELNRKELISQIGQKKSCLCVGLDSDLKKLPEHFSKNAESVFEFNKAIIDATQDVCVAYKINTAFYESMGTKGWQALENTVRYIPDSHFKIADAKRGDIGNTSAQYAKTFFEAMPFDALTVSPYMGRDSIEPFLQFEGKWVIILALTSNPGSNDFQKLKTGEDTLWQQVLKTTSGYGNASNTMYVVGATQASELKHVRNIIPDHFLLVPGVGAQGGSLKDVMAYGKNTDTGLIINVSRAVIFAGHDKDFAKKSREAAIKYHNEMKTYL